MRSNKGVTLIELMVVLGMLGVVLSIIFFPLIFSGSSFKSENEKANICTDVRTAMDYLTRQIRKSGEVEIVDGILRVNGNDYRVENRILFKDVEEIIYGIDELNIEKDDRTITIEIIIKNSKGEDYKLSSIINIR